MEVIEAVTRRRWGVRREFVARALPHPTPFDLAPPPWATRLLEGGSRSLLVRECPLSVAVRDAERFSLASARVAGAGRLDDADFERAAADIYVALADVLRARPGRHPVRFWNHIPGIRKPSATEGIDRYMVFNAGRFAACSDWFGSPDAFDRLLPTASGVGHDGSDLVVHVLAGDAPGTAVENPRQVPSYRYSRRFGPRPPCFARATTVSWDDAGRTILVGGTASIRGEETVHAGNLMAQTRETFDNLAALVRAAGARGLQSFEALRVYYVHEADRRTIERTVSEAFPDLADVEYARADLCRSELLVEIEGVARSER